MLEFNSIQNTQLINSIQLYKEFKKTQKELFKYSGSLYYSETKGKEYLLLKHKGKVKSFGVKSQENDDFYQFFHEKKKDLSLRIISLKEELSVQRRLNVAVKINQVPEITFDVISLLSEKMDNSLVLGTNALYAYTFSSGVFLDNNISSTVDIDIFVDLRKKIKILNEDSPTMISYIQKNIDKTFKKVSESPFEFSLINDKGYMIDFIQPISKNITKSEPLISNIPNDIKAIGIQGLEWLMSAPRFTHEIIGKNGSVATLKTVDPRAFALYKMWLSEREDRSFLKRKKDKLQSLFLIELIENYMPYLEFKKENLSYLPERLISFKK